ncbi:nitrogen assimilation response regulator NtrX [Radicibacter daui]|uniref:nitrogen assimilation response regulator NtrX n=1 Tax=Radicibacter daui TaxID=3064829 RepID=UPI004046A17A
MSHDILIVDDEADIRSLISGILDDEGYSTRQAGDADQALEALRTRVPAMVILDIWLIGSRLDGLGILDEIQRLYPGLPVVMISGHGTIETAVSAIQRGAYDFIEKPFKSDRLLLMVERAIEAARLRRENAELKLRAGTDDELTGKSAGIQQVRQQVDKVAPTGSRVLITGEAGVGKEVVARMIHTRSRRVEGPFVVLNCAALNPDRLEIELFGQETAEDGGPGKVGTFERAHGGTLLLDEVGDMPLETQSKIVRVLQEQNFSRVGGTARIKVDVRVLATTSQDLLLAIADGRFRQDFYYRLAVVPIAVPRLTDRRDDIPMLARSFMTRAAQISGIQPREFGEDALAALQAYTWPGNVRQLRNVVDWLLIMTPAEHEGPLRADMLPPEIGAITPAVLQWEKGGEIMGLPLREARELFEREYLLAQVTRFGGNISRTAAFVGMERSALHRKLKSLGVHGGADRGGLRAPAEQEE